MRVLALDTTTRGGSVALVDDDRVIEERPGDRTRTHAERLPREITDLLAAHALTTADVERFAVASGPGSFTGLRIGIATIQGLAFVHRRPVAAVSALDALAVSVCVPARRLVAAWMDAHRGEVFSALYETAEGDPFAADGLVALEGPMVGDPVQTLRRWAPRLAGRQVMFVGDGAALYEEIVRGEPGAEMAIPAHPLLAAAIGRIATRRLRDGELTGPAGIRPLYVRRPDAEIARDRVSTGGER